MSRAEPKGQAVKVKQHRAASADMAEDFRKARTKLDQITIDIERLRKHAATLVKSTARTAK